MEGSADGIAVEFSAWYALIVKCGFRGIINGVRMEEEFANRNAFLKMSLLARFGYVLGSGGHCDGVKMCGMFTGLDTRKKMRPR